MCIFSLGVQSVSLIHAYVGLITSIVLVNSSSNCIFYEILVSKSESEVVIYKEIYKDKHSTGRQETDKQAESGNAYILKLK